MASKTKKKKRGRPKSPVEDRDRKVLGLIRAGYSVRAACEASEYPLSTFFHRFKNIPELKVLREEAERTAKRFDDLREKELQPLGLVEDEKKQVFLEVYRKSGSKEKAASAADLNLTDVVLSLDPNEDSFDEAFALDFERARKVFVSKIEDRELDAALFGDRRGNQGRWVLEKLDPDTYGKQSRVEVAGSVAPALAISADVAMGLLEKLLGEPEEKNVTDRASRQSDSPSLLTAGEVEGGES